MIEVRVLGSVEVLVGGTPVTFRGRQPLAVLAMLVAARGRLVTADQIIDRLWNGAPPAKASSSLQVHISRLRRLLEPRRQPRDLAHVLVSVTAGYALRLPDEAVDVWCFERDLTAAAGAPPDQQSGGLQNALARWRGAPYAQFIDEDWVKPEVARLFELHHTARERAVKALLAAGRRDDAIVAAQTLTTDEPLRGEAWRLLALALWANNRSAEALTTLQRHRRLLADELGLDPEPAFAELEQAILEQRHEPLTQSTPTSDEVPPAQLPRRLVHFTAREDALGELDRYAATGLVVISGTAGIGKTALAVHWVHRNAARYPDGQLYADLRGHGPADNPADPTDVLLAFLTALHVPEHRIPTDPEGRTSLLRTALTGRRVLLMLDNARDADQVRPLLPGADSCLVVVTSRNRLVDLAVTEDAHLLRLDSFTTGQSQEYLRRRLGAATDADPVARDALIARCGGLPLALALICARPTDTLAATHAELASETGLDAFAVSGVTHDLRAILSWSYRGLTDPAARLFRLVALHPGPDLPVLAGAALADLDPATTRTLLRHLCDAHLLAEPRPGRFRAHDLLRAYGLEAVRHDEPSPARDAATDRLIAFYLHTARNAAIALYPYRRDLVGPAPTGIPSLSFADTPAAVQWYDEEHDNLTALTTMCQAPRLQEHLALFDWALVSYRDIRRLQQDTLSLTLAALGTRKPERDPWWKGYLHYIAGRALLRLGKAAESRRHLEKAIAVGRAMRDPARLTYSLACLAVLIINEDGKAPTREQATEAYPFAQEARQASRVLPAAQAVEEAICLHPIAWYHAYQPNGQDEAERLFRESIAIQMRCGYPHGAAGSWVQLGRFHQHFGAIPQAIAAFHTAIELYANVRQLQMEPLLGLFTCHRIAGDSAAAEQVRLQALDLLRTARYPDPDKLRALLGPEPQS